MLLFSLSLLKILSFSARFETDTGNAHAMMILNILMFTFIHFPNLEPGQSDVPYQLHQIFS